MAPQTSLDGTTDYLVSPRPCKSLNEDRSIFIVIFFPNARHGSCCQDKDTTPTVVLYILRQACELQCSLPSWPATATRSSQHQMWIVRVHLCSARTRSSPGLQGPIDSRPLIQNSATRPLEHCRRAESFSKISNLTRTQHNYVSYTIKSRYVVQGARCPPKHGSCWP